MDLFTQFFKIFSQNLNRLFRVIQVQLLHSLSFITVIIIPISMENLINDKLIINKSYILMFIIAIMISIIIMEVLINIINYCLLNELILQAFRNAIYLVLISDCFQRLCLPVINFYQELYDEA